MIKYLNSLLKKISFRNKSTPKALNNIPEEVYLQSLMLSDDEILVYKDPQTNEFHYFTRSAFDPNKEYSILIMD